MFKKKSIVLTGTRELDKKAVMTLEEDGIGLKGMLRLYNFPRELSGISSLGFYVNKKVYKAGLTYKSNMLYEFFISLEKIPTSFSCAVVNFLNAEPKPILYGSSEGNNDDIYASIITEISGKKSMEETEKVLDGYGVDFDDEEKEIIEKEIDEAMCTGENCENCKYKKFFEEHQNEEKVEKLQKNDEKTTENSEKIENFEKIETLSDKKVEEIPNPKPEDEEKELEFFFRLKPQIDRLFEKNPAEKNLQNLIPSSKWAKVEYEDDGDFYVFGLLYDEEQNVKYVCYGVPAVFEEQPPEELSGYPMWLPLDKGNFKGFGYWLTYQDASTGEPVKAIID